MNLLAGLKLSVSVLVEYIRTGHIVWFVEFHIWAFI